MVSVNCIIDYSDGCLAAVAMTSRDDTILSICASSNNGSPFEEVCWHLQTDLDASGSSAKIYATNPSCNDDGPCSSCI